MRVPGESHVCGWPSRTRVSIPTRWTHAAVTVRVITTVSPTVKPAALLTSNDRVPEGTYDSVRLTVPLVARDPDPRTSNTVIAEDDVINKVVPPLPEPLPRTTTPPARRLTMPLTRNVPGPSRRAPRKPFCSGRADTASIAAWSAARSSPPEGLSVRTTGTSGRATPPPP